MQQITLNIIFDGTKIRLDTSGIHLGQRKNKGKMPIYRAKTVQFTQPVIKIVDGSDHEFDIVFPATKVCEGKGKNNLLPGTTICQNCYSQELGEKMQEMRRSKRQEFVNYQVLQQNDKELWLKELNNFVLDNEKFLDQDDYGTSSDFIRIIKEKQEELNPTTANTLPSSLGITELLSNISQPKKSNPKLKTNLTVPQLAFLFKLLYELKPDIFDVQSKAELQRFISANFSTKGTSDQDISTEKLKQLFSDPDPDAAAFWRKHFLTMLAETKQFN